MTLDELIQTIKLEPVKMSFSDVMAVIASNYDYTPADFLNGTQRNTAGTNEGSCKIFAFAKLNTLNEQQTLACFGDYYRQDVLLNPKGIDHTNIRNFIQTGWDGIKFDSEVLVDK